MHFAEDALARRHGCPHPEQQAEAQHQHEGSREKLDSGYGDGSRQTAAAGHSQQASALAKTAIAAIAPVVSAVPSAIAKVAAIPAAKRPWERAKTRTTSAARRDGSRPQAPRRPYPPPGQTAQPSGGGMCTWSQSSACGPARRSPPELRHRSPCRPCAR